MEQQQNCVLVDKFAIFVQILLAAIAFSTLIYKRHRERPQRPLSIWAYDVSKQIIGAIMIHGLNILASYIPGFSKEGLDTNPLDCTVGVFLLYLIFKAVQSLVISVGIDGMKSGDYGQPPKVKWWLQQTKLEGMKLEDGNNSRDEGEVFLPVDISDDEMNYENLPSYLKGSNVSLYSNISASASLLRETFSNSFRDEDKSDNDSYIELLRRTTPT
ncbi:11148_t:CDS:2 [Acaulospora colombiana]|uniref:11148_t:CDS:1 n=1 Tax=Acaulospora colombiana TaxID=27376 RepID=A0ACA9L8H8_9GLOM|nr:11148_t:CDS:2 [Acaulospora colombiana]